MFALKQDSSMVASTAVVEPKHLTDRVNAYYQERLDPSWNGEHLVVGRAPGHDAVQLFSNDYLALANHPEIIRAQVERLEQEGRGVLMSDVFRNGEGPLRAFERAIAGHVGAEEAVVCQSGWNANVGLVQSIAGKDTPVYIDMFAHMSLWEGIRAAGAEAKPFKHNDMNSLERLVARHGPGVICVDSVYSTIGDICPLPDVCRIAAENGCAVVADESHSLGVFGAHGEGLVAHLGLSEQVHFQTASLSKAFSARGGIVTGSTRNLKYFRYESRPAIFSSGVLAHEAAGFLTTLEVIKRENARRIKLMWNANYLRTHLSALGYNVDDSQSQILALVAGPESRTKVLRDALEDRGIFGAVFCAPATPKNRSLVRFSLNSGLGEDELNRIIAVCEAIRDEVALAEWHGSRLKARQGPASLCA